MPLTEVGNEYNAGPAKPDLSPTGDDEPVGSLLDFDSNGEGLIFMSQKLSCLSQSRG